MTPNDTERPDERQNPDADQAQSDDLQALADQLTTRICEAADLIAAAGKDAGGSTFEHAGTSAADREAFALAATMRKRRCATCRNERSARPPAGNTRS
jgi:hypothetical protein